MKALDILYAEAQQAPSTQTVFEDRERVLTGTDSHPHASGVLVPTKGMVRLIHTKLSP